MLIGNRTTGQLASIRIVTGGKDYTSAPGVVVSGAGGTGVSAVAVMAGTRLDSVIIANGGTGHTASPTVSFTVPSAGVTISSITAGTASVTVTLASAVTDLSWPKLISGGVTANAVFFNTTQLTAATTATTGAATLMHLGSGASAVAYAHTGALRPMSFFKGRFGTVYGVDGMGRGIRWPGGAASVQPIGLHKPAVAPVVTAGSTSAGKRVSSIQMVDGGRGYSSVPTVTISGGTPTRPATAQALIVNGSVVGVRVSDPGSGYQSNPTVSFSGGLGSGAAFGVGVNGVISGLRITNRGSGYVQSGTQAPTIAVNTSNGLTGFVGSVVVNGDGLVDSIQVINPGSGATTTPTFTIGAGTGSGAAAAGDVTYSVVSVSATSAGSGFFTAPFITVRPAATDPFGGGAELEATVNTAGEIASVTVARGGPYTAPPTALIADTHARAQASVAEPMRGKYLCAIRYIDNTDPEVGGPFASSISHLVELEAGTGSGQVLWTFAHPYVDDRVTAMELWRTSGDQAVVLFRVATIQKTDPNWATTYTDTLSDPDLTDPKREGYGLMPVTLPSGQINARRFEVPSGKFAVGVMFQDRTWYAVDTSGQAPNSLYYSEIDEPESVPAANELVLQENTGLPDRIVALVPFGSMLLICQTSHIYQMMYVAQPVLDASILLAAHRGVLNSRCWGVLSGVAFLVDSVGLYAFDGNSEQSISVAVDNYWRDRIIDFSKSDKFHVACDPLTRTVRFYYCRSADSEPVRALCYCTATQAWWEEQYATAVTATSLPTISGQLRLTSGGGDGAWRKESGTQDGGTGVAYSLRTGNMSLTDEPDRGIAVQYKPTTGDSNLNVSLHFNNSDTARQNAIQSNTGTGFTVTAGGPAEINLKRTRSALGEATGTAVAHYSGRKSERSAGGDQHLAVQVAGTQAADQVALFGVRIMGVK